MNTALSWPALLTKLLAREDLTRSESSWAMDQIMHGDSSEAEIAAFILALRSKRESPDELAGLVDSMLSHALILDTGNDALDIVGTGGDMAGTVNVSTMAAIVAAAAGVPVMKHGSRSASGKTGSSEMLEVLGVRLDLTPQKVAEVFKTVGITFLFAPVFHPAMRHVAPIRKKLGIPTTFNFLGPLANPAQPIATSLGVANPQIAPIMAQEMARRGRYALVFRGNDGLDELTTTTASTLWIANPSGVSEIELRPEDLGLKPAKKEQLVGGDAKANAQIARDLMAGKTSGNLAAIKDIVLLNAAGGVVAYQGARSQQLRAGDLTENFGMALNLVSDALGSGRAAEKLESWVLATQS